MAQLTKEKWFVNDDELDDEQYNIKRMSLKNSYVVKGCAGSGKTILALWRAIEAMNKGESCKIIVYTIALKRFIVAALSNQPFIEFDTELIQTYGGWDHYLNPGVSHFIIDEAQDFTTHEINILKNKAGISIAFFGDSAQKLYPEKTIRIGQEEHRLKTLSVEDIAAHLNLPIRTLKYNHRLPKTIARFAQGLSSSPERLEGLCKKDGLRKPQIVYCADRAAEIDYIVNYIETQGLTDVGILLPHNNLVESVFWEFLDRDVPVEAKYRYDTADGNTNHDDLNFSTDSPKIMTYHSAKGLQFQTVFLPFCSRETYLNKTPLYVACTRSSDDLKITYSGELNQYLNDLSKDHYDFLLWDNKRVTTVSS